MQIVLRQILPLGRFHATPWKVNPFDDPHGEWPPSPWRLARAVVARWYQWAREAVPAPSQMELEAVVRALATSSYSFRLPSHAQKGAPLRQYFPAEFSWNPKAKKKPGMRSYGTSLAQDNYWCMPCGEDGTVWWFLEGDDWTDEAVRVLDRCLERVIYFGRAESFTRIRRSAEAAPQPNCMLAAHRTPASVPVLVPSADATRADVERVTDDPAVVGRSIPHGACVRYAIRPPRPQVREKANVPVGRPECRLLQFAIGWNVAPDPRAIVRLTSRFRGVVLRELLRIKTGGSDSTWADVGADVRAATADMFGKDGQGHRLSGNRHTEFLAWCEDGIPVRLLVWRASRAFDEDEQTAILRAASREVSWAAGFDADAWKARLIPLDGSVPPPPGFDGAPARCWESVTPYVPPRHHLRKGKERLRESLSAQICRELGLRGFGNAERVEAESIGTATWVSVHVPRKERRAFLGDRRGYWMRLTFPEPVRGPFRLGHSSTFGLGLFRPSDADAGGHRELRATSGPRGD
jgi:CRISPR-associated protein Csb2